MENPSEETFCRPNQSSMQLYFHKPNCQNKSYPPTTHSLLLARSKFLSASVQMTLLKSDTILDFCSLRFKA